MKIQESLFIFLSLVKTQATAKGVLVYLFVA